MITLIRLVLDIMNPLLVSDNKTANPIRKVSKPRRYTPENGNNRVPAIDILRLEMNINNVVNPTRAILDRFIPLRALPMQIDAAWGSWRLHILDVRMGHDRKPNNEAVPR